MMQLNEVSIVGAGLGGLAAALAIQRYGMRVRVYEQAARLAEVGAGVHQSPNGLKVLKALGLQEVLERDWYRPKCISTRHYQTGVPNFEGDLGAPFVDKFGAPFVSLHRADLHNALIDAVRQNDPNAIVLDKKLIGLTETPEQVELAFADGSKHATQVLIAADGVHSVIRSSLYGELGATFTGHVAYRGLVSVDAVPTDIIEPKVNVWVGPGKHVVAYYVRRGELVNYVAIIEERGWETESWTTKADKAQLAKAFEDWHPPVQTLIDKTLDDQCFKWALLNRVPLPHWSTPRITLIGDAAHPMVPYLAQGAVMAIEDGWVLAHALANQDDVSSALATYEATRIERTTKVQHAAWEQGQQNHAVGTEMDKGDFKGGNFADTAWIYGHDVCATAPHTG